MAQHREQISKDEAATRVQIVNVSPPSGYKVVTNALARDARMSFRARGLLVYLIGLPSDWRTSAERLAKDAKEGRDAIRAALAEIEAAGYLRRIRRQRPADGRHGGQWETVWYLTEVPDAWPDTVPAVPVPVQPVSPMPEKPSSVRPGKTRVKPATEKPASVDQASLRSTEEELPPPTSGGGGQRRLQLPAVEPAADLEPGAVALGDARLRLGARDIARLAAPARPALPAGWTPAALCAYLLADLPEKTRAVAGVYGYRLANLPAIPAQRAAEPAARPAWCGQCDERTRIVDAVSAANAPQTALRCPRCHPAPRRGRTAVRR